MARFKRIYTTRCVFLINFWQKQITNDTKRAVDCEGQGLRKQNVTIRGRAELLEVMDLFCIYLSCSVVTHLYTVVKIHQIINLKIIEFNNIFYTLRKLIEKLINKNGYL